MIKNVLQIVACYLVGLFVGTAISGAYFGGPFVLSLIVMMGGAVLALPILLLVVLMFVLLRKWILRHLALWCVVAPVLIVVVWMWAEWQFNYSNRGNDLYWYLSLRNVWERAVLALTCASIASFMFWYLNRTDRLIDAKIPV
jgi:hypothetical protein